MISLFLLLACGGEEASESAGREAPPEASEDQSTLVDAGSVVVEFPTPRLPQRVALSPFPVNRTPDIDRALLELGKVVDSQAGNPDDPWAIAHGILARGAEFELTNGENAVDWLFARYARTEEIHGRNLVYFPAELEIEGLGNVEIEPHTDLVLKALAEVGLRLDHAVEVEGQAHQFGEVWWHSVMTTWLNKSDGSSSYVSPNDMPWGMQGIASFAAEDLSWGAKGQSMVLDDMAQLLVHILTQESTFMIQQMNRGQDFEKRGQGVFAYTCGGAHLLQGAAHMVARGFGGDEQRDLVMVQGPLLLYRFPRETAIYREMMSQYPAMRVTLLAQQLKFTGHWLESVHKLAASGLFVPDPVAQVVLADAVMLLVSTVVELKQLGVLDNLSEVHEQNPQLYLDLVGDSAHAIRGLELALGEGSYLF